MKPHFYLFLGKDLVLKDITQAVNPLDSMKEKNLFQLTGILADQKVCLVLLDYFQFLGEIMKLL